MFLVGNSKELSVADNSIFVESLTYSQLCPPRTPEPTKMCKLLSGVCAGWLSKTGRCLTFDNNADGWVHGDAAVNVVVKTLRGRLKKLVLG